MAVQYANGKIATNGLILALDAGDRNSYSPSQNMLTFGNDISNAIWTKQSVSVVSGATTSPDGTLNATLVTQNTANDRHVVYNTTFPTRTSGTTYTVSFFVKSNGTTKLFVELQWTGSQYSNSSFDFSTKTKISGGLTPTYVDYPNGWTRVIITGVASANSTSTTNVVYPYICLLDAAGTLSYTGDGTSGAYFYGFQMESNSSVTDYKNITTTWTDLSGNNNNGTFINGPIYSSQNGGSVVFDGTNDSMSVSSLANTSFPQNAGTISIWYNIQSSGGTVTFVGKGIFDDWDSARDHIFIRNYYNTPNNLQIGINSIRIGLSGYEAVANYAISVDVFHNIVVTYTTGVGGTVQFYIDGVLMTSSAIDSGFRPTGQFVGFGNSTPLSMQGKGNMMHIYNRAITATEVLQNYNAQKARFNII
jgi:hypothetical protein